MVAHSEDERRLMVFANMVLRRIFGPRGTW
jgi:hypothetical protein